MKNFQRQILLTISLLLFIATSATAQIGISPQKHDLTLDGQTRTQTFRLFNFSDEPREMAVTVNNWRMDETNRVETIPPTATSLDQWIIINPLRFMIPPGESQAVRFAIRPAVELPDGEHRAMVYFTEQLPPDDNPEQATVRAQMRIGAAIYAQVGPVDRSGTIDQVSASAEQLLITMTNTGSANTRLSGSFAVRQAGQTAQSITGRLPQVAVLPGDTRTFSVSLGEMTLSGGNYVLDIQGELGDRMINRSWDLTVP